MDYYPQDNYEYEPGPYSCRRRGDRSKIVPSGVKCWSDKNSPQEVVLIEADTQGARVMLPWAAYKNQIVSVSFCNSLGMHRTEKARVAWVQELGGKKVIVGLSYLIAEYAAA